MKTNPNESAFTIPNEQAGLTKRELLAGMALQGLLSDPELNEDLKGVANCAVLAADALITELNKEKKDV